MEGYSNNTPEFRLPLDVPTTGWGTSSYTAFMFYLYNFGSNNNLELGPLNFISTGDYSYVGRGYNGNGTTNFYIQLPPGIITSDTAEDFMAYLIEHPIILGGYPIGFVVGWDMMKWESLINNNLTTPGLNNTNWKLTTPDSLSGITLLPEHERQPEYPNIGNPPMKISNIRIHKRDLNGQQLLTEKKLTNNS